MKQVKQKGTTMETVGTYDRVNPHEAVVKPMINPDDLRRKLYYKGRSRGGGALTQGSE